MYGGGGLNSNTVYIMYQFLLYKPYHTIGIITDSPAASVSPFTPLVFPLMS